MNFVMWGKYPSLYLYCYDLKINLSAGITGAHQCHVRKSDYWTYGLVKKYFM